MTSPARTALQERIQAVLSRKSMLDHPFYRGWNEGALELTDIHEYTRQYYHFELAFPRFLSAIHTRTESLRIRQLLLDNLWDEEHGDRNHPALWLDFAESVGLSREEVATSQPNTATQALVDHFHDVCRHAPLAEALATLFAYEGQVPSIAWQTIKSLTEHYDFAPQQFEFFSVHLVADISHAGAEMDAIQESCIDEDGVIRATETSCDLLLRFLDGCSGKKVAA
jgi:pyrroloquinoline-quinone synthase